MDTALWHWGSFILIWRPAPTFLIWAVLCNCVQLCSSGFVGFLFVGECILGGLLLPFLTCCYSTQVGDRFLLLVGKTVTVATGQTDASHHKTIYSIVVDFCGSLLLKMLQLQFTAETNLFVLLWTSTNNLLKLFIFISTSFWSNRFLFRWYTNHDTAETSFNPIQGGGADVPPPVTYLRIRDCKHIYTRQFFFDNSSFWVWKRGQHFPLNKIAPFSQENIKLVNFTPFS